MPLQSLSAFEIRDKLRTDSLTPEEVVQTSLDRIAKVDSRLHAFLAVDYDSALSAVRELQPWQLAAEKKPLLGIPVAIKDNICTVGLRTSCASRILESYVPPYDATVTRRIREAGGIIIGKTNMDEFAMGSSTETSYFGPTLNPWNRNCVAGGSSGGSAAAVVAKEVPLALGSDTGGSIRCPASFCGAVGLKPTYGMVSRYGLIAYSNSLEQIGPFARNVRDCALLLSVIAGYDPLDSTSAKTEQCDYTQYLKNDVKGLRVGIVKEFFGEGTDSGVERLVRKAASKFSELGADCEEVSLPALRYSLAAYYLIAMSEASSNLARYDGLRYGYSAEVHDLEWNHAFSETRANGFGKEARRRILLGTFALSAGYYDKFFLKALKVAALVRRDFRRMFREFDAALGPTMPFPAFKIGEKIDDPLSLYKSDVDTVSINLAGVPAISIPCGLQNGLPVGLQIIAPHFREDTLLGMAYTYEVNTDLQRYSIDL